MSLKHAWNSRPQGQLIVAVRHNEENVVKTLLAWGADINEKDEWDNTPLMWAARLGHKEIAEALLDKGADVNRKNTDGDTALIVTALTGHTAIARLLVEKGADIHTKNNAGHSAILIAASQGHRPVVELLKEHTLHSETAREKERARQAQIAESQKRLKEQAMLRPGLKPKRR